MCFYKGSRLKLSESEVEMGHFPHFPPHCSYCWTETSETYYCSSFVYCPGRLQYQMVFLHGEK